VHANSEIDEHFRTVTPGCTYTYKKNSDPGRPENGKLGVDLSDPWSEGADGGEGDSEKKEYANSKQPT